MRSTSAPVIDPTLELPAQLKALRLASGKGIVDMAQATGLSRLTVSAAEGKADVRLSTLAALFDALGYSLVPVPKEVVRDVASFINNGGTTVSLPAGVAAPLGSAQQVFFQVASRSLKDYFPSLSVNSETPNKGSKE